MLTPASLGSLPTRFPCRTRQRAEPWPGGIGRKRDNDVEMELRHDIEGADVQLIRREEPRQHLATLRDLLDEAPSLSAMRFTETAEKYSVA
jgi:hypothetical protein